MESRTQILRDNGFPKRYLALANNAAAHSDDEELQDRTFSIREPAGRSLKVKDFFRLCDERLEDHSKALGKRSKMRKRVDPPVMVPTKFTKRPKSMAIDFWDPQYFNGLSRATRKGLDIQLDSLTFPLVEGYVPFQTGAARSTWESMSDSAFAKTIPDGFHSLLGYEVDDVELAGDMVEDDNATDPTDSDEDMLGSEDEDTMSRALDDMDADIPVPPPEELTQEQIDLRGLQQGSFVSNLMQFN